MFQRVENEVFSRKTRANRKITFDNALNNAAPVTYTNDFIYTICRSSQNLQQTPTKKYSPAIIQFIRTQLYQQLRKRLYLFSTVTENRSLRKLKCFLESPLFVFSLFFLFTVARFLTRISECVLTLEYVFSSDDSRLENCFIAIQSRPMLRSHISIFKMYKIFKWPRNFKCQWYFQTLTRDIFFWQNLIGSWIAKINSYCETLSAGKQNA